MLGIEQNNLAPALIQSSGSALVQGIRQIGQQISGHLTELQTKRDLGALAQEMQGMDVQSDQFPIQLAQLTARHPLAAKDERAQMILKPLGVAHAQWQAEESDARAFNRAMAMQTRRTQDARSTFDYEEGVRLKRPVSVSGVGLVDPTEIDPVTGQAKVLAAAAPRSGAMPFASTPNGVLDKRTGALTPLPAKAMTPYQQAQLRRAERKDKVSALNQEINQFDSDIASAVRQYESSFDREQKAATEAERLKHQADKTAMGTNADALKAEKAKRLEILKTLRQEDEADAAIRDEPADVLPPLGATAAAPASADLVLVIDPNGVPGKIKASQLEAALQNGYKRR